MVNTEEFTRRWKQIRGQAQQWWGKLNNADLARINGQWELFVGVLREKYGYTRETVEFEFSQRLAQLEARERQLKSGSQAPVLDVVEEQWQLMHSQARVWWDRLSDDQLVQAAGKADAIFSLLQAEYGYSSDRAEAEFKRRMKEFAISQQEHPTPETLFI